MRALPQCSDLPSVHTLASVAVIVTFALLGGTNLAHGFGAHTVGAFRSCHALDVCTLVLVVGIAHHFAARVRASVFVLWFHRPPAASFFVWARAWWYVHVGAHIHLDALPFGAFRSCHALDVCTLVRVLDTIVRGARAAVVLAVNILLVNAPRTVSRTRASGAGDGHALTFTPPKSKKKKGINNQRNFPLQPMGGGG